MRYLERIMHTSWCFAAGPFIGTTQSGLLAPKLTTIQVNNQVTFGFIMPNKESETFLS